VVLAAACWCLNMSAQAQYLPTYPSPVGAARMPEPIPCGPAANGPQPPEPNLVPGPISPLAAPMGPPNDLSLPYDHTGAFQCENYVEDCGVYVNLGPMALQRNKLGAGDIAVLNARGLGEPIGPILPNPFVPAPPGAASAQNFNSLTPPLSLGVRGTVGYLWNSAGIEFTSFYIFENDVNNTVRQPGDLDLLFYNPPLTFTDFSLWRRADEVSTTYGSSLWSNELNYRRWNVAVSGLELIAGVRFVRQNDILGIMTEATTPVLNALNIATPGRDQATYSVLTHNNIVAPQLGMEYNLPIFSWLSFATMGKGAWGANFLDTDISLTRGDGFVGFDTHRSATVFSQIYEMGAFADFHILEKFRLRLGYTATWLIGVAASNDQVDFNLEGTAARQGFGAQGLTQALQSGNLNQLLSVPQTIPHGRVNNNGSMIYFGPQIELQFFF
jgi:hypothetical protein